jgi:hypothetical protein
MPIQKPLKNQPKKEEEKGIRKDFLKIPFFL